MISPDMLKETMEHFSAKTEKKPEQTNDRWAGFKSFNVGGQEVIDLTSIDEIYEPVELRCEDVARKQLYGTQAGDQNKM